MWDMTWAASTWADHGSWLGPFPMFVVYPNLPDKQLRLNVNLTDARFFDSISKFPGTAFAANYLHVNHNQGEASIAGSKFERNGQFESPTSVGTGGLVFKPPAGGSVVGGTALLESSEWTANGKIVILSRFAVRLANPKSITISAAGMGPAVFVFFGQFDLRFRNCLFQHNVGTVGGGAIYVLGPQALTLTIVDSTFDSNAVRPVDADIDLTVVNSTACKRLFSHWAALLTAGCVPFQRVNTGSFAIDADPVPPSQGGASA